MKLFLLAFAVFLGLNAGATVTVDKCSSEINGDRYVSVIDGYDNLVFSFHEVEFSTSKDLFTKAGNVLSVNALPVIVEAEGVNEAKVVSIVLVGDFSKSLQVIYSFGGSPFDTLMTSCESIQVD